MDCFSPISTGGFWFFLNVFFIRKKKEMGFNSDKMSINDFESLAESKIYFSGEFTDGIAQDIERLYKQRPLFYRIIYLLCSLFLFYEAYNIRGGFNDCAYSKVQQVIFPGFLQIVLLIFGLLFIVVGFLLEKLYWRWWYKLYLAQFGPRISGRISLLGIKPDTDDEIVPWENFITAKINSSTMLLYLSNAYVFPLHKSIFASDADWEASLGIVKEKIKRKKILK
jgi:hypothetical protein